VFITNIYVVIVTDITNINFQLQKSVITNITKGCNFGRHFVLHFVLNPDETNMC